MAVLHKITECSYILQTDANESIGVVVDYTNSPADKTGIEFFSTKGRLEFNSIADLERVISDKIKYKEHKEPDNEAKKLLQEYPVNDTDSIHDIQDDETGMKTFSKSKRSQKRFFAGWWIVHNPESSTFTPRLTISKDTYLQKELGTTLYGPFKSYMEVTLQLKTL